MAKCGFCDLKQNEGTFETRGIVTGTKADKFYDEVSTFDNVTKTTKVRRSVNFGVEFDKNKSVYLNIMGFPKKEVVYYGKLNPKDEKGTSVKIPWANRMDKQQDGLRLIGINLGLTKYTDEKGKVVNNSRNWTEFDACEVISRELQDGVSVYVKGKLEFSSFPSKKNEGEMVRNKRFVPNQISLTNEPVNFEEYNENNQPRHHFTQNIVLTGVEQDDENKCFLINGYVVTYRTIEPVQLKTLNGKLAKTLKKACQKDYIGIDVSGYINVMKQEEEVEVTDDWGDANTMKRVNAPSIRELIVTGADPATIDEEGYTKKLITEALDKLKKDKEAEEKFGKEQIEEANDWGSAPKLDIDKSDDDSDDWMDDWSE